MSQQMKHRKKSMAFKIIHGKKCNVFVVDKKNFFSHVFFLQSRREMEICSYVESTQTKKDPKAIAVKIFLYMI
jgi:hypothetical protein